MRKTLETINEKIVTAFNSRSPEIKALSKDQLPCLVAVSKLKPIASILEAYECGQRHFGENYFQELLEKSNSKEILEKCPDIKFHLIGHLQSNKVNKLPKIRNLDMIHTVDSIKLANLINKAFEKSASGKDSSDDDNDNARQPAHNTQTVKVMIQVNTSGEEQKSGIQPDEALELAKHIRTNCNRLELSGLMTIGKYEGWGDQPNLDFVRLSETRNKVAEKLCLSPKQLDLSMGMSGDFEEAITMGSSLVRVGTLIFGAR